MHWCVTSLESLKVTTYLIIEEILSPCCILFSYLKRISTYINEIKNAEVLSSMIIIMSANVRKSRLALYAV